VPEHVEEALTKALAPIVADRFPSAAEFARALQPTTGTPAAAILPSHIEMRKPRTTSSILWLVLAVGLAGLLVIGGIQFRGRTSPALNANLLAVAPFDVPNPELKLWQEGLVDVLSRNFDGAGSLHSVPPTVVVRRFKGRADRATATELGRRTGARLVLFGALLGAGDSARLSATLLDVERGRVLGEVEVRDSTIRMDRLADSLTVRLLRELGRTRRVGAVLSMSFGSTSLPALRAFLQGEQFYRLGEWDSAMVHYEQAISLDSTLAPAYRRMANVVGWQREGGDSLAVVYGLRAGSLNHGLAPRESLLVTIDSLIAAAYSASSDSLYYALVERLFSTTAEATRRYPNDPEAWYALGEVRHHMGEPFGVTGPQVLEAFNRSIALDSAFAPAYIHNVDLALSLHGPDAARRYVRAYLALDPSDIHAVGIRAVARMLDTVSHRGAALQRLLDTLPASPLGQIMVTFWRFPDPEETAAKIFRRFAADARGSRYSDPGVRRWEVGIVAYRGHLREAYREVGTQGPASLYALLALLRVIPRDTARVVFARWLNQRSDPQASLALPWWAATGDTLSLRRFMRWHDSPPQPGSHRIQQGLKRYWAAAAGGYLALARRDSAEALRRFTQLPESLCSGAVCLPSRLTKAELLSAQGQDREAAIVLHRDPGWTDRTPQLVEVFWLLERGRVAERLNDREQALRSFHTVADAWLHADPELQPYVAEARAAIQRLSGEVH
jgi:eukaryotic-like serine/threonine-protein kinase